MNHADLPFSSALVTGGAGFVGSHLADRLKALGLRTSILDNFSSGFEKNIPKGVTVFRGDVRDTRMVHRAAKGVDIIFHLAEYIPNRPGHVIRFSAENPNKDLGVCVGGTVNALEEARKNDAHFVMASTAAVYGSHKYPVRENFALKPISPYGAAKLCAETYVLLYQRAYGLPVTILRLFNLYGPRQRKYLMYDCLTKLSRDRERIELLGTGQEIRDYIFISDAIDRMIAVVGASKRQSSPIFNIGTGKGRTTKQIVEMVARQLGANPKPVIRGNPWVGNIGKLVADMSKTERYFAGGTTDFSESLRTLVSWFLLENP